MNPLLLFFPFFYFPLLDKGLCVDELLAERGCCLCQYRAAFANAALGPSEHFCAALGETNWWA